MEVGYTLDLYSSFEPDIVCIDPSFVAAYQPFLERIRSRNPVVDASGARCHKDHHLGANAAFAEVMKNAVSLDCQIHFQRHVLKDQAWGLGGVRKQVADFCMAMAKVSDPDSCVWKLHELSEAHPAASAKLKAGYPLEELFPAMRYHPTAIRNKKRVIGPTWGTIASNEAEVTMHMLLQIRRVANIAEQQLLVWKLRQRRHRELAAMHRRALAKDKSQPLPYQGALQRAEVMHA